MSCPLSSRPVRPTAVFFLMVRVVACTVHLMSISTRSFLSSLISLTHPLSLSAEDNMNSQLRDVVMTTRDGRTTHLEQVYLRGSHIRYFVVPDMLRQAPMFQRVGPGALKGRGVGMGRGLATVARAQGKLIVMMIACRGTQGDSSIHPFSISLPILPIYPIQCYDSPGSWRWDDGWPRTRRTREGRSHGGWRSSSRSGRWVPQGLNFPSPTKGATSLLHPLGWEIPVSEWLVRAE